MTYKELDAKLQGRCKHRRKLGNNTYAVRRLSTSHLWGGLGEITASIDILYHSTYILSFHSDGDITVDIGRWYTITTKQRLNKYLPDYYGVFSRQGTWFVYYGGRSDPLAVFTNGMTIHENGRISGAQTFAEWIAERVEAVHKARSEGAKRAAATRRIAQTTRLFFDDAYYA